jgi:C1A family cysteine protease
VYSYSYGTFIGHAVAVVGYNDTGSYFICQNSRGTAIEDGGFFKISYSEVGGQTEFGLYSAYYIGDVYAYGIPSTIQGLTIQGGTLK